jgi:hypothetical protein
MVVSLDTLIIVGAFVVAAIYLVAQVVAGVNLARLHEARRIAADALRDELVVNPLLGEQRDGATRDRAAIERLIADRPSSPERALHTERRGSP